jgi:hypothetical protein
MPLMNHASPGYIRQACLSSILEESSLLPEITPSMNQGSYNEWLTCPWIAATPVRFCR